MADESHEYQLTGQNAYAVEGAAQEDGAVDIATVLTTRIQQLSYAYDLAEGALLMIQQSLQHLHNVKPYDDALAASELALNETERGTVDNTIINVTKSGEDIAGILKDIDERLQSYLVKDMTGMKAMLAMTGLFPELQDKTPNSINVPGIVASGADGRPYSDLVQVNIADHAQSAMQKHHILESSTSSGSSSRSSGHGGRKPKQVTLDVHGEPGSEHQLDSETGASTGAKRPRKSHVDYPCPYCPVYEDGTHRNMQGKRNVRIHFHSKQNNHRDKFISENFAAVQNMISENIPPTIIFSTVEVCLMCKDDPRVPVHDTCLSQLQNVIVTSFSHLGSGFLTS